MKRFVTGGSCYTILPKNFKSQAGEKYFFNIHKKTVSESDEIKKLKLRFSSSEGYLDTAFPRLPGIETNEFTLDAKSHKFSWFYFRYSLIFTSSCNV